MNVRRSSYRRRILTLAGALPALSLFALAGCGGSTATSTSGLAGSVAPAAGGSGATRSEGMAGADGVKPAAVALPKTRFGLFATASPAAGGVRAWSHIWTTVLKVELLDADDKTVTVIDSTKTGEGLTLDLASLSDASGLRFAPLASVPQAEGTKTARVRLTFARSMTFFAPGDTTGTMLPFADTIARDSESRPTLSFPLAHPRDLGTGKENLVLDFDLAKLVVKDDRVLPALRETDGGKSLSDPMRQEPLLLTGTVSDVAGAGSNFLLTTPDGRTAYIEAGDTAALFNDGAVANPQIAEGGRVQVRGYISTETKRLVASAVKVYAGGDKDALPTESVAGQVQRADGAAGTMIVNVAQVSGLVPTQSSVTVSLAPDAVLRSRGGLPLTAEDFWKALGSRSGANAASVRVEGIYEPVTGALIATRARLEDASAAPAAVHEADVTGVPATFDEKGETLTIAAPLVAWDGIAAPSASVPASTAAAPPVDTKGGKPGPASAKVELASAKTDVPEKAATTAARGVSITLSPATVLHDEKGETISSSAFFVALKEGKSAVRVIGVYGKGGMTATRAELRPLPAPPVQKIDPAAIAAAASPEKIKQVAGMVSGATGVPADKAEAAIKAGVNAATAVIASPAPTAAPSTAPAPADTTGDPLPAAAPTTAPKN